MRISDWSSDVCSSDLGFRWTSADAATPPFAPNAFIRIDRASNVTLVMPNQEMGQGIYTAHSQLLAEELDVSLGDRKSTRLNQSLMRISYAVFCLKNNT